MQYFTFGHSQATLFGSKIHENYNHRIFVNFLRALWSKRVIITQNSLCFSQTQLFEVHMLGRKNGLAPNFEGNLHFTSLAHLQANCKLHVSVGPTRASKSL